MTDRPEFALLAELAKLVKKYGPGTFEALARDFSSPEFAARLTALLTTTARGAREAGIRPGPASERRHAPKDLRPSLIELGTTEVEKSELLVTFYDGLRTKSLLPTMRDIRAFASDVGLLPPTASSREKAIAPLVRALLPLSLDELKKKLSGITMAPDVDDRSLEGWSKIILGKDRTSR